MGEKFRICRDRLQPRDLARPPPTMRIGDGSSRAIILFRKLWVNGSTLRVRFPGGTAAEQAVAKEQAGWWIPQRQPALRFQQHAGR